jgi:hypothetical protein
MPMPLWVRQINELKDFLEVHLAETERPRALKMLNALGDTIARPPETVENLAQAMTPAPYGILQRPDPVCSECGLVMQVRHTGGLTYVIDHGPAISVCPNSCKMWKMLATYIPFKEEVFVPPFVREAMEKP